MCLRYPSADTMPGANANPASIAEKMPSLQRRSKSHSRPIDGSMGAHAFTRSCMHKESAVLSLRVARLMREQGLAAKLPRHRIVTTNSEKDAPVAANLLQQDFHADQPRPEVDDRDDLHLDTRGVALSSSACLMCFRAWW